MLEGRVKAGQLPGDPEHRVIATLWLKDVSSQETFYFTVNDDIKCIVCQNSGGTELGYCLRQYGRSVIHHPLREQTENCATWCQHPRSSRRAPSDPLQIQSKHSHMKDSWFVHWYQF